MVASRSFLLTFCVLFEQYTSAQTSLASNSITPSKIATESNSSPARLPSTIVISRAQNATTIHTSTTEEVTAIAGLPTSARSSVSTTTSARPRSSNTTPCNGYPEFCQRKYSNISMVLAHNSPFVKAHNAASNQIYPVLTQLNDGVRGLSFETQKPNSSSTIRLCHTSCDLLDVGTLASYLTTVRGWLDSNPYEVISIQMGNNNGQSTRIPVEEYATQFEEAGMTKYLWTPPSLSMNLTDWPTLGEMILKNQRVVVTMDSGTNQTTVPWILNELNYQWTTPFSPTNPAFPCTQSQPSNQAEAVSRNRMYLMNHNLNINISLAGFSDILIPAYSLLGEVNAVSGNGSLGLNVQNCEKMWGRPPNWLLVDYYNFGNFNGSVFQVAATANGVTYKQGTCCGGAGTTSGVAKVGGSMGWVVSAVVAAVLIVLP